MAPPDDGDATHFDIVRAIGRLEGGSQQNFDTLFHQARATDEKIDNLAQRIAKLEVRRTRLAPRPQMTWKTGTAIAAAVIAILGGLSSAYDHAAGLLGAIDHYLRQPPHP